MAVGMNGLGEGLFHVKLGSQTCGMFQSWRLVRWVREKERGNGSWLCRCERGAGLWGPGCEWGGVGAGEGSGGGWVRVAFVCSMVRSAGEDTEQAVSFVLWLRDNHALSPLLLHLVWQSKPAKHPLVLDSRVFRAAELGKRRLGAKKSFLQQRDLSFQ